MTGKHDIQIKSVMTPFPRTIDVNRSLLEARQLMAENDIRHLPVSKENKLMGIISERDIHWALDSAFELGEEADIPVEKIYRRDTYHVQLDSLLPGVLEHMFENRIGSALVLKDDKLVGIFTAMDACKAFASHLKGHTFVDDPEAA